MFYRTHLDKLIYPVIALVLLVLVSYRPKYHLRADMPSAFFSAAAATPNQKRGLEQRIASACWESAQMAPAAASLVLASGMEQRLRMGLELGQRPNGQRRRMDPRPRGQNVAVSGPLDGVESANDFASVPAAY